ncbi:piRNA biogenesis protein EXD1 [Colletotrichum fructicola]|nr:piRNA biogenesis protein EXD1 [Colletotrichum fructicola]KAF4920875.1 piRNA biogenesis protein EXD1 [Colletotrichum fructicola]
MNTPNVYHSLIDSTESVLSLLKIIQTLPTGTPSLFLDLEGVSLSRHGSISLITIFVQPQKHVYLVDIHTLQSAAFSIATVDGTTLKSILESPTITKVFFDVRNDSDALYSHFGVKLRGIEDVQLMENAARPGGRRFLNGLEKCINTHAPLSPSEKLRWKAAKEAGLKLFHPSKGGSYEVFNSRPIDAAVELYCINDVQYLPQLREVFLPRLKDAWHKKVTNETEKRVVESQSELYEPQSETKKFGPWW